MAMELKFRTWLQRVEANRFDEWSNPQTVTTLSRWPLYRICVLYRIREGEAPAEAGLPGGSAGASPSLKILSSRGGNRTHTIQGLSLAALPVGVPCHRYQRFQRGSNPYFLLDKQVCRAATPWNRMLSRVTGVGVEPTCACF